MFLSTKYLNWQANRNGHWCYKWPNDCCNGGCPTEWALGTGGILHELGHNLNLGHANQCVQNIQNQSGGDPRNTWYDRQIYQIHRTLAITSMQKYVNECSAISPNIEITGDVTYNDQQRIYQNIVVKNGGTLTVTCELRMPNVGVIVVEPGGKLIVDGGKITNINNDHCGNKYWRGIEVLGTPGQPQNAANCGILELKNEAVIENASVAVKNYFVETNTSDPTYGDYKYFGGIIRASDSKFLNNTYSVDMRHFQNFHAPNPSTLLPDISYFIDCDFMINDDFFNPGQFNRFMAFTDVAGIAIKGCTFENNSTVARSDLEGGVGIIGTDASFRVVAKSSGVNAKRSSFKNLHIAVYAVGIGGVQSVQVDRCDFVNNDFSILISGSNLAKITRDSISVGRIKNFGISTAITSFNSTGYTIEENHISQEMGMTDPTYGIRVFNSGTASNEVYRNTVTKMQMGIIGEAINRSSIDPDIGLAFKCDSMHSNSFDFVVSPSTNYSATVSGIKETQGASNLSAGNEFDPVGNQAESHYKVAVDNPVNYYGHSGNGTPDTAQTTAFLFTYSGDGQVECESSFGEPGGGDPTDSSNNIVAMRTINNSEHASLDTVYANLFYNRSQLIDGGSTPQLLIDIQNSWNEDALNLRNDLLESSPLSKDAFMEAANTGILPDALLLEVALANPDATQSMDIIDQLQYEIPNTLDQNAIALIIANWGQETPLGILEAEMGAVKGRMEVLNNRIIRSFLLDPSGYIIDSIEYYMTRNMGHSRRMAYINWLSGQKRFEDAQTELTVLYNNLPEGEYWSDEYSRFDALIDQKEAWHNAGKSLNALDSSDKVILDSWAEDDDLTGAIAKNLLMVNFDEFFYLPPVDLGEGARRALFAGTATELLFQAKVYPNPADDYVSFQFSGTLGKDIILSILDQQGRELKRLNVNGKRPVKSISTKNLSTGQYYYRAVSGEQVLSGKLNIIK